jgi:hypothetical protein
MIRLIVAILAVAAASRGDVWRMTSDDLVYSRP